MRPGQRPPQRGRGQLAAGFWDAPYGLALLNLMEAATRVLLLPLGAGLVYLIIGLYVGDLARSTSPEDALKYRFAAALIGYSAILLAVSLLGRPSHQEIHLITSAIIGVVCLLAIPLGVSAIVERQGLGVAHHAAVHVITGRMVFTGRLVLALCVLRGLPMLVQRALRREGETVGTDTRGLEALLRLGAKLPSRNLNVSRSPFAACWQLPYCIDYIKTVCDPFNKTRRTCWRDKSGCHCDMRYLAQVLQGQSGGPQPSDVALRVAQATKAALPTERQVDCAECRIFLEHQRRKFRLFSHFSLPVTVGVIYAVHAPVATAWQFLVRGLLSVYGTMAFREVTEADLGQLAQYYTSEQAVWIVLILAGMFLLSGVMRGIEYLILELKL